MLFFAHIPFVVNRAFSSTPAERLQQYLTFKSGIHYRTFFDIMTDLTSCVWSFQHKFGRWLEKARKKLSAKLSKGIPAESLKKGGPEVTVFRSPPLISTPAHRGRWKQMEADNEKGA